MGQPVDSVQVSLEADYDARADFGLDGVPPGFQQLRLRIEVDSPGDRGTIEELVAKALGASTWLDVLVRSQTVTTEIRVNSAPLVAMK
jgi:hypothetical protein